MFFYVFAPLGQGFEAIWHPMVLLLLAALAAMLWFDRGRYWPTWLALGVTALMYAGSFAAADATWWADFINAVAQDPSKVGP